MITYTDKEKQDILNELINMAHADSKLKAAEIAFIKVLGGRLGVEDALVDYMIEHPEDAKPETPQVHTKRIVHFHRMMLMMHIDGEVSTEELQLLHEVGLRYGIRKSTITTLLETMKQYPHGEIPPTELIEIHMRDHN